VPFKSISNLGFPEFHQNQHFDSLKMVQNLPPTNFLLNVQVLSVRIRGFE
jgi:hypothetical protein